MRFRIVIPARLASSRLPEKPLVDIGGEPMVVHCYRAALLSGAEEVVVAVDHRRIYDAVKAANGEVEMTDPHHRSGTDRIAEVAQKRAWSDDTIVVNMQGDEPLMPPALLSRLAGALSENNAAGIATMATPIEDPVLYRQESVVKVVIDKLSFALLFSRAPIPWVRGRALDSTEPLPDGVPFLRHLGLYAYRVRTLRTMRDSPPAAIENAESLEQLRALREGIRIHVTVIEDAPPHGVDTPADLERVRRLFRREV